MKRQKLHFDYPINAHISLNKPGTFDLILQAKASWENIQKGNGIPNNSPSNIL